MDVWQPYRQKYRGTGKENTFILTEKARKTMVTEEYNTAVEEKYASVNKAASRRRLEENEEEEQEEPPPPEEEEEEPPPPEVPPPETQMFCPNHLPDSIRKVSPPKLVLAESQNWAQQDTDFFLLVTCRGRKKSLALSSTTQKITSIHSICRTSIAIS